MPVEFIGLARQLIKRIADRDAEVVLATERLLLSYRPREGWTPMPNRKLLQRLPAKLRAFGRGIGRLKFVSKYDAKTGRLQVVELRLCPSTISAPGWAEDEIALGIELRTLALAPPAFPEKNVAIAGVGLHALARRFERATRTEAAVLADLRALAEGWRDAIRASAGEIEIAVPGGRWRGARGPGDAVAVVRTFVDG